MLTLTTTSGDPVADRRFAYASDLAAEGDMRAAADLAEQALELVPGWAAGWNAAGDYWHAAGEPGAALKAWGRAVSNDTADPFGAGLKISAVSGAGVPDAPPSAYVETLFDAYAPDFETALVQRLHYQVPQLLEDMIASVEGGEDTLFSRAIDLGCGTGLMGERLRRRVSFLEGVDLSDAMLDAARAKSVYDRLDRGELVAALAARNADFDLVTAADVFMYCGALAPVFAAVARVLTPGGVFAFSVEAADDAADMLLRSSLRYAHAPQRVLVDLAAAGLDMVETRRAVIRHDRGAPVGGFLVVARRPHETASALEAGLLVAAADQSFTAG